MSKKTIYSKIYSSPALSIFFEELENRFPIEDAQNKYSNLVNFSTNIKTPYHQWFKYREGFAAELIQELIKMSGADKSEVIIDPFCGSGTTNVVAAMGGYNTLGLDVNPMSAFITQAKTNIYSKQDLELTIKLSESLNSYSDDIYPERYESIKKYFDENNFLELIKIRSFIETLCDNKSKTLLFVAFLSIIEECSNRKRDGNGLKTIQTKITNVVDFYQKKVELIVNDIKTNQPSNMINGFGIYSTAFKLADEFETNCKNLKAGTIIFSPPYANSFDYFESYKLELVLSDYADGVKGLNKLRKKAVRSFIGAEKQSKCDKIVDLLAEEIESDIPKKEAETGRKDTRTRKVPDMLRGYFSDMHEVVRQCSILLENGKRLYIVVDQSAYLGKIVPTDLILAYYAENEGFSVKSIINCRKARTSTQQLKKYPYLKNSLRESIVCLEKI